MPDQGTRGNDTMMGCSVNEYCGLEGVKAWFKLLKTHLPTRALRVGNVEEKDWEVDIEVMLNYGTSFLGAEK